MRPKERINVFLDNMDLPKVLNVYFPNVTEEIKKEFAASIYPALGRLQKEWNENPDWRFPQLLVNMGFVPNMPGFWYYMEETQVLLDSGCEARKVVMWGNNFDKDMNRLSETIWKPICELTTDHIHSILNGGFAKNTDYEKLFKEELTLRAKSK